jgi:signal transduction histidine kinase
MPYPLPFPTHDTPLHLLVVDDQEFDRKMIVSRLKEVAPKDTIVVEADSGKETMLAIASTPVPFDCVLLDMNLADIHGVDLTTMILGQRPELSIVMITAEGDMDKALKCLKAGAEDFLVKGEYTNMGLYRSVRYAIERHRAAGENFKLNEALRRERELSAAQKEFIHLVSHEFRTPIAIISGALQLLAAKAPELKTGVGSSQFEKIERALVRLVGLLDNVLRLSMVEEGKEVFSPAIFDMCGAIRLVTETFDEKRIRNEMGDKPMHYYGDERLVEYALHNVISNGMKYSPGDAPVTLRLNPLPSGLELLVIDEGAGMSPATIARAGEKFHRASSTSHIEGTGLGIHLAKRFMEYHSGQLSFESELGKGTTVRLFFPYGAALIDNGE